MNIFDLLIVILAVSSIARGYQVGFARQALSTIGFVIGLWVGSQLGNVLAPRLASGVNESIVHVVILFAVSFLLMSAGEAVGIRFKRALQHQRAHQFDGSLGSVMSVATMLLAVWIFASVLSLLPPGGIQPYVRDSRIVQYLDMRLPPATKLLSALNKFIDPNAPPRVFSGNEPLPGTGKPLPPDSEFASILARTRDSVVKIEGLGCGGIVDGSGFVSAPGRVVTNAHVVAGVSNPTVIDTDGRHAARVVLFDDDNDIAVLAVDRLTAAPLRLAARQVTAGQGVLLAGYPAGGSFDSQTGMIVDSFTALGRDIYNQDLTSRNVYSIQARIVQGNSGGPVIDREGNVTGVIFATSTAYNNVGYALTLDQVHQLITEGNAASRRVSSGQCSL